MFTGIVQGLKPVSGVIDEQALRRLDIDLGDLAGGLQTGASVAVNGTCLTVAAIGDHSVRFDVIQETLDNTNLGTLRTGSRVNVERSFRLGDEVGGHILSGHVSGVAVVVEVHEGENVRNLAFTVPRGLLKFLHYKGFVALDGASLTIASVDRERGQISVALIPETIARTTLGALVVGNQVNLEVDAQTQAIVETVERVLADQTLVDGLRSRA
ncbi:MAG: riboflavin synthase subunit alpha [Pseudomonadales bacterium]|jgi:riboflavin synthase|nr:riboflavin synthase subunit alpha [Pseudomonadales bacterium]MDP6472953.1 riboflavin synthase subunit alpha [Pseudomonadales bacterium]MDP6826291.1 riboflavin synthase subunit alpha [Pseudomonadales bacterium]MDP6972793.1 riboflavin synthase subunit alpha [Pseudomonadales bacterium]|tara:strand:- start:220 stop:858 length:639 start_codon:yes stop_codon:yes gene_type:complete